MLIKNLLILVALLIFASCANEVIENTQSYEDEIKALTTDEQKKQYLETILKQDQLVRGDDGDEIALKHGYDSQEYSEYVKEQWRVDNINLSKIEIYLDIHGYPDKTLGTNATITPWFVIHHAQSYEARERNFEVLYKAYLNKYITGSLMSGFLHRMHYHKFGKELYLVSPFIPEIEINKYIKALGLEEMKANVLKELELKSETTPS